MATGAVVVVGLPGRRTPAVYQPAVRAASSSAGRSDRNRVRPGRIAIAAVIVRYASADCLGPAFSVSKNPSISGSRSPFGLCANQARWAATEPDEYTYWRRPAARQRRRTGTTSS